MPLSQRANHMDVSNTVDVTDSSAVIAALRSIVDSRCPDFDFAPVNIFVEDFIRLYQGDYPGYAISIKGNLLEVFQIRQFIRQAFN